MSLVELDIDNWLKNRDKFDLIIDARSPSEFAYSRIKGAINLYVLNDKEHNEIGTLYKQNRSLAKVLGARYVCLNTSEHLPKIYEMAKVGSLVGVYCSRGGMRSNSISQILSMIGYRVERLIDGYKSYRKNVLDEFEKPISLKFITLFGNTGSSKTKLIRSLQPSLDLEHIANHLGSVFGEINGKQPSQKEFEDNLFEELILLKDKKACFIEGESRRIGSLTVPSSLHTSMRSGINVEIVASLENRVECIMKDYKSVDSEFFYSCMKKISPFISKEARDDAINAYENNDIHKVCEILLVKYYDKVYKKPQKIDYTISSDDFELAKSELMQIYNEQLKL
ncbi:tRNA 2-selenouridine(34) synthase MnmH [Campylobacter pinnipediorum]|uniref:tRNA 2-selenouridine(34) synthase MnmH n=1 Tax=Campylobacter pinnipediorum TaxID=1965231 RepID=UPI000994AC07|nr:tRNA 2-selenouridine(34) synthase MnmH [Campylobacter pinnipediorum]AQW83184.1 tRNA 2-selenouridine synthase [Campylobacter pinnipediorum subsp. pinnipediorum]AQW84752.1 tRNA 2-selenouridine synthase [Campylobacter pinnipediorum subsp. pinnipediorum]